MTSHNSAPHRFKCMASWWRRGFTLVELLVSMTVLSVILLISASFVSQTQKAWSQNSARVEQFREARMAFETITQSLRQATLNTYLTYQYNTGANPVVPQSAEEVPQKYVRQSELQFVTGPAMGLLAEGGATGLVTHAVFFQGAMGLSDRAGYEALNRLLCGRGYFIQHSSDDAYRPPHVVNARQRYRLWEYRPPSERNEVYSVTPGQWFKSAAAQTIQATETIAIPAHTRPVAENIIALIISPQLTPEEALTTSRETTAIAPNYVYDSTKVVGETSKEPQGTQHLLPPVVSVTLVALDEASAARYAAENPGAAGGSLVNAAAFNNAASYAQDLAQLEESLVAQKLNYRVFSTSIVLRNSKWNQIVK